MSNKDYAEYNVWKNMRRRCNSPKSTGFKRWGGRGIKVCERWASFANFLLDMGHRPSPLHTIDRKNNDGDYTPQNCRWATHSEQNRNRSTNRIVIVDGHRMTLAEAVERKGMDHSVFLGRLRIGWSEEKALSTPVKQHGKLTLKDAIEIEANRGSMRDIAAKYGIGLTTVWRIKQGQRVRTSK